ncbi:hypothetical protein POM88_010868 [Heracleum sosnowskyi]|uniref:Bifunctional inhibitor/plant lipid transfer protein/seed storage helical domain-containing protein n=1 Tax=Heracleum sosnowskyi TaxID=360622 RepID=A0AAD8IWW3_9APIA|nr:hypothetical protein POM88_010868 [Heracleum sosnowskyi]
MAKPKRSILPAFFIVTFLVVTTIATTYTTTITTTTITGNNEIPINSKCKLEKEEINDCLMYLSSEGDSFLDECCSQLKEVKSNCQCKALKEVVWQVQQQKQKSKYEITPEDMKQTLQFAQDLPRRCFLDFSGSCVIASDPLAYN